MYVVLLCARNEEEIIERTVKGIFQQGISPKLFVVVDDGSKDNTLKILEKLRDEFPNLVVIKRKDRGFSALGTYIMADTYNHGLRALRDHKWTHLLIIGADTRLPYRYVEKLVDFMDKKKYDVASGRNQFEDINSHTCHGAGRIISRRVMDGVGHQFIRTNDWESTPLRYARIKGWKVGHTAKIPIFLTRPGDKGHKRSHIGWGRSMKDSCYHPLVVLMRVIRIIVLERNLVKGMQLLVGYLSQNPNVHDRPEWIAKTREYQKQRIIDTARRLLKYVP